jgi:hypothetical protein
MRRVRFRAMVFVKRSIVRESVRNTLSYSGIHSPSDVDIHTDSLSLSRTLELSTLSNSFSLSNSRLSRTLSNSLSNSLSLELSRVPFRIQLTPVTCHSGTFTHSCESLTHSLACVRCLVHPPTHTVSLFRFTLTHPRTHSFTHSSTHPYAHSHSPTHPFTYSLVHSLTHMRTHSRTLTLSLSLSLSLMHTGSIHTCSPNLRTGESPQSRRPAGQRGRSSPSPDRLL